MESTSKLGSQGDRINDYLMNYSSINSSSYHFICIVEHYENLIIEA